MSIPAFSAVGIELEYMIVDRESLSVRPVADELVGGAGEVERGKLGWSNELVLHVMEIKNQRPGPLEPLPTAFQAEIQAINRALEPLGARLMPSGAHPWMDPKSETRLWPHDHADLYQTYHRIFDCHRHGWANLQSMHLNLPFADDAQFARLHAAARLILPILPALAASSPIIEGRPSGFLDTRMEAYRTHPIKVPSLIGRVVPDTLSSRAEFATQVLEPMYRDIAPFDPAGSLRHEWLNCRGAIPRFDRHAVEIRVIDVQECPAADIAIAAAATAVVKALYDGKWSSLETQQAIATGDLADILLACIRDGERTVIGSGEYLRLLGFPGARCEARDLWHYLIDNSPPPFRRGRREAAGSRREHPLGVQGEGLGERENSALNLILDHGPLARRILNATGPKPDRARLTEVYRELCDCLEQGRLFQP